ncbi:hypothetical protein AB0L74_10150 [Streptomyces sp. NPDC052020]|uniref:hypothetical protein n=1 Tax=Streptomyces sp. NPDC052020 TaxID=3155677 RepID=UPI003448AED4
MKFAVDPSNNLRRMCAVRGDGYARVWKVRTYMRGRDVTKRFYLCWNTVTGEFRVVSTDQMSALY